MSRSKLSAIVLSGLLTLAAVAAMAADASPGTPGLTGSALPPGVNPSSPAGGNGGDANGYDTQTPTRPAKSDTNRASQKKHDGKSTTMQNGKTTQSPRTKSPGANGQQ